MRCIINNGHILRKANYKISIIDTRRSESDLKKNVKHFINYWFVLSAVFNFFYVNIGIWKNTEHRLKIDIHRFMKKK